MIQVIKNNDKKDIVITISSHDGDITPYVNSLIDVLQGAGASDFADNTDFYHTLELLRTMVTNN